MSAAVRDQIKIVRTGDECECANWPSSLCFPGNVFVIAAIILERNLQNVANYLVASLAVADLFVACLVMPLGALYEVRSI